MPHDEYLGHDELVMLHESPDYNDADPLKDYQSQGSAASQSSQRENIMKSGNSFLKSFTESEIKFPPTLKYIKGTSNYDLGKKDSPI